MPAARIVLCIISLFLWGKVSAQPTTIKEALKSPTTAISLDLTGQYLDEKSLSKLGELTYLRDLTLGSNSITSIPVEVSMLSSLINFKSKNNELTFIPPEMGKCFNVTNFELFDTKLDSFPEEIAGMGKMQKLVLVNNTAERFKIPATFNYLDRLKTLDIERTKLDTLPSDFLQGKNLQVVALVDCGLDSIPPIGTGISTLYLNNNQLKEISNLAQLTNLVYLSLQSNLFERLPESIVALQKLRTLDLRGNPIHEDNLNVLKVLLPNCNIVTGDLTETKEENK